MTAGPVVSGLLDSYGDSVVILGLHGFPNEEPWTNTRRTSYYASFFAGYPTYLIDGAIDSRNGDPVWDYYDDDTDARLLVPTDVTIELQAAATESPEKWEITATVCIEASGTGKSMRIYMAEVLDGYPADAENFTRNGLRQVASTEDIVLAAEACTDVMRPFAFDTETMASINDLSIIAWAQDDLPAGPAKVYQATQLRWPFDSSQVFSDGFESGNTSGWTSAVP